MMTWFTRASLFDAALDLELPELALTHRESNALFMELVYDEPDDEFGPAPAPLRAMWVGYEVALAGYSVACAATLVSFGVSDLSRPLAVAQAVKALRLGGDDAPLVMPPWLEDVDVLVSHRSNMMRRWPDRYDWPRTPPLMPYVWPVVTPDGKYTLKLSKYDRELLAKGERALPASIQKRIS